MLTMLAMSMAQQVKPAASEPVKTAVNEPMAPRADPAGLGPSLRCAPTSLILRQAPRATPTPYLLLPRERRAFFLA